MFGRILGTVFRTRLLFSCLQCIWCLHSVWEKCCSHKSLSLSFSWQLLIRVALLMVCYVYPFACNMSSTVLISSFDVLIMFEICGLMFSLQSLQQKNCMNKRGDAPRLPET